MLSTLALAALLLPKPADSLAEGFRNPPASARPHTWWHWMNGNVTKEGITADLKAMKEVGIGGAQLFTVDQGIPAGTAPYMSAKWRELTAHAIKEAGRLGIEVCLHNCAGWSSSGGPWLKPQDAMQVLAWSEAKTSGPKRFNEKLPQPEAPRVVSKVPYYRDIAVYAFRTQPTPPKPEGFLARTGVVRANGLVPNPEMEHGAPLEGFVDLTSHLRPDGRLEWEVPEGEWTILRMGHVPTGKDNHPAPPEGTGLEVDKLSREALKKHWDGMMAKVIADVGPLAGKVLNNGLIDSYEVGSQNWTPKFREEFRKRRGYEPTPFLPAVAGYTVGTVDRTERFLWDFRRTIADLFADNYLGYFAELCHRSGMQFSTEPYGDGNFDNIQAGSTADIPMGEFWNAGWSIETAKLAASVGHVYGRPVIGAESFTSDEATGRWLEQPYAQKAIGDRAFCEGVNRYIFHRYAHQPWLDVKPGMTMGPWGTHFDRTQTWWTEAKEWMRYVSRSQYLLQQGRFVADIAYYYGEDAPLDLPARPNIRPEIPKGYDYDGCDANAVLSMSVKNGRLTLPSGMSYSVLVLPLSKYMTVEVARKVKELVAAGATVVGPKPEFSPSLSGFPASEQALTKLAFELWGAGAVGSRAFGKGKIVTGVPLSTTLSSLGLKPDFEFRASGPVAGNLMAIHRRTANADLYFVSNQRYQPTRARLTFRVKGKVPEVWHPDTGKIEAAPAYSESGGRVSLTYDFSSAESVFVVFRESAKRPHLQAFVPQNPLVDPALTPPIKIVRAWYGTTDGRGADVSNRVRSLISQGEYDFSAGNSAFGDPVRDVVKRFSMDYTVGGVPRHLDVAENTTVSFFGEIPVPSPAYSTRVFPDGGITITPWRKGTFTIQTSKGKSREIRATREPISMDLSTGWDVAFAPNLGAPARARFPKLISWPDHTDPGIRYFSGSARYTREFDLSPAFAFRAPSVRLDLGKVQNFATVTINGTEVATLWKPPFVLDITRFVTMGRNKIEVKVTNLWPNRIIGDEQFTPEVEWNGNQLKRWPNWLTPGNPKIAAARPKTGRVTFATWRYFDKDSPLLPSGLLGPVKIEAARPIIVSP